MRRYGYIDKVSDVAVEHPQFWLAFVTDQGELKDLLREIEVLRNLAILFRHGVRVVEDRLLIVGDAVFRVANAYYNTVRAAARNNASGAEQVFQMLQLFWRRRLAAAEPTEREVMRDFKALLRGTKDGRLVIESESDKIVT